MHVLLTGGTGFIGEALVPALIGAGHDVTVLSRSAHSSLPKPVRLVQALEAVDGSIDAVINLAGASLAGKRWSEAYKAEIVASRLETTRRLGAYFASAGYAPQCWLNASAIGYYGAAGDEVITEDSPAGEGFAATLCRDWEAAAGDAAGSARLCLLRLGVVLDRNGGAYQQMALPFRFGFANWVGSGEQWFSWIHRADVVAAMLFLLQEDMLAGPFNLTAPEPQRSRDFCTSMKAHHRTLLTAPMPAALMRLALGEMADELLINGQRVLPTALQGAGFEFLYPTADEAIGAIEDKD